MHDLGNYIVKCVKPGGDTLALYSFSATEGQVVDLLDPTTPDNIRAVDYYTADNMCRDTGFELAAKIQSGLWVIVEKRKPSEDF